MNGSFCKIMKLSHNHSTEKRGSGLSSKTVILLPRIIHPDILIF